ncbi:MAG: ATP-binding cassette domain-containing protein [Cycloclasticus sp.]|nr:ATP-binding cassette domain-containing protein [Cycloclasticus sp.]
MAAIEKTAAVLSAVNLSIEPVSSQTEFDRAFSYEFTKGSINCIIGPNSSGKSHYLRMLAGIEEPASGKVFLQGKDIDEMTDKRWLSMRQSVGFISESVQLFSILSGIGNVMLPANYHSIASAEKVQEKADRLVTWLGCTADLTVLPNEITRNQRFFLLLARALILEPEVLLVDEPFRSNDSALQKLLTKRYTELRDAQEMTLIFSTNSTQFVQLHEVFLLPMSNNPIEEKFF